MASPPRKEIDAKRLTADWEILLKQLIKLWEPLKVHITGDIAQPLQVVYTFIMSAARIKRSFVPRVMRLWIEHNGVLADLFSVGVAGSRTLIQLCYLHSWCLGCRYISKRWDSRRKRFMHTGTQATDSRVCKCIVPAVAILSFP